MECLMNIFVPATAVDKEKGVDTYMKPLVKPVQFSDAELQAMRTALYKLRFTGETNVRPEVVASALEKVRHVCETWSQYVRVNS